MTGDDLDRLAALIAAEIRRVRAMPEPAAPHRGRESWLPVPVRPEPPVRGTDPPAWAAQALPDVAPSRSAGPSTHRDDIGAATAAIRAAAAGRAPTVAPPSDKTAVADAARAAPGSAGRRSPTWGAGASVQVPLGISNRHVHLSVAHVEALFGSGGLTVDRAITQPGQYAARERVTVHGPAGRIEGVRVVGPPRGETQLEVAPSDARVLGIVPPVQASGSLDASLGGVRLEGSKGSVQLARGVIIPRRHLHLAPADATRLDLADGAVVSVRCGAAGRVATLHEVLVRSGPTHATELHLDVDEARALGVEPGGLCTIVGREAPPARRPLLTERDVRLLAAQGRAIPENALLTPSARDRARALGMRPA